MLMKKVESLEASTLKPSVIISRQLAIPWKKRLKSEVKEATLYDFNTDVQWGDATMEFVFSVLEEWFNRHHAGSIKIVDVFGYKNLKSRRYNDQAPEDRFKQCMGQWWLASVTKDVILYPIIDDGHYSLAVSVPAPVVVTGEDSDIVLLHCDSLPPLHEAKPLELCEQMIEVTKKKCHVVSLRVPQQMDSSSCGPLTFCNAVRIGCGFMSRSGQAVGKELLEKELEYKWDEGAMWARGQLIRLCTQEMQGTNNGQTGKGVTDDFMRS